MNNKSIEIIGNISEKEANDYIEQIENKFGSKVKQITIEEDCDFVNLNYTMEKNVPFERIRRITGYLVGDMLKWNDAKKSEEHDRVKHALSYSNNNDPSQPLITVEETYYALENGILSLTKDDDNVLCLKIDEDYHYCFEKKYDDLDLFKVSNILTEEYIAHKAFNMFRELQADPLEENSNKVKHYKHLIECDKNNRTKGRIKSR